MLWFSSQKVICGALYSSPNFHYKSNFYHIFIWSLSSPIGLPLICNVQSTAPTLITSRSLIQTTAKTH